MSEKIAEIEGKLSDAASEVSVWRSFIEHAGWKKLEVILNEQFQARLLTVGLSPLESLSRVPAQEFMKGEANAYGALRSLPQTQLELAEQQLRVREVELTMEKDHVSETTKARSGSRVDDDNFSRE